MSKKKEPESSQLLIDILAEEPPVHRQGGWKDGKDPVRVAAGKRSKRKGGSFERSIVNALKDAGIDAKRGWWQSSEFARCRGQAKPTIPDVIVEGFWLELGTGAVVDDYKKLDQAESDSAGKGLVPVAITRRKGQRVIYATLSLYDLVDMIKVQHITPAGLRVSVRFDELVGLMQKAEPVNSGRPPLGVGPMFSGDLDDDE